jgi:pimeloyl-ACP methyl ester carboxylesterase
MLATAGTGQQVNAAYADSIERAILEVSGGRGRVHLLSIGCGRGNNDAEIHRFMATRHPELDLRIVGFDAHQSVSDNPIVTECGGLVINDELEASGATLPLPDRSAFGEPELVDMSEEVWKRLEAIAVPEPAGVATEKQQLSDERRYDVPAVVITSTMPEPLLRQFMAGGHPYVAELARARSVRIVELPTGHWPQLTKPAELAAAVVDAVTD